MGNQVRNVRGKNLPWAIWKCALAPHSGWKKGIPPAGYKKPYKPHRRRHNRSPTLNQEQERIYDLLHHCNDMLFHLNALPEKLDRHSVEFHGYFGRIICIYLDEKPFSPRDPFLQPVVGFLQSHGVDVASFRSSDLYCFECLKNPEIREHLISVISSKRRELLGGLTADSPILTKLHMNLG